MENAHRIINKSPKKKRRKSTEQISTTHRIFDYPNSETLNPQDFSDVFGGPPKTILSRKSSVPDLNLYQDVFRSPTTYGLTIKKDRNLPVFGVKEKQSISVIGEERRRRGVYQRYNEGFYDDIFGSDDDRRSKLGTNKSRSNSSSVLSSDDFSPLRPSMAEDVFFSSFSSKLRPISIPLQRSSSTMALEERQSTQGKSDTRPPLSETHSLENKLTKTHKSSPFKSSQTRSFSSPETSAIEHTSFPSIKPSIADTDIDSPSSVVSSLWNRETDENLKFQDALPEEDDDDEIMSSYVIEISCEKRKVKKDESVIAIDEAIAWAKEKYQPQCFGANGGGRVQNVTSSATKTLPERKEKFLNPEKCNLQGDAHGRMQFLMVNEKLRSWITEEQKQSENIRGFGN